MEKTIKEIVEILNRASKFLPANQVDELETRLFDGAWKKLQKKRIWLKIKFSKCIFGLSADLVHGHKH